MFDKFKVLMSWKISWGLSFLFFGVSDGHIFFDFSNYCPNYIASKNWYVKKIALLLTHAFWPLCRGAPLWVLFWKCLVGVKVQYTIKLFKSDMPPSPLTHLLLISIGGALVGRRGTSKWFWWICKVGSNRISSRWEGSPRPPPNQLMKKWEVQYPNIENY